MADCAIVKTTRENWFEVHPMYLEMKSYGYGDEECLREAMLVYLDLIEVKHWFDVELCRCDAIRSVYFVGRPLKKCHIELVVPVASSKVFSNADIHAIITAVCQAYECSELGEKYGASNVEKSVYFAIVDGSSTSVYYKMTIGLVTPDNVGDDDAEADSLIRWKKNSKSRQNKS